MHTVIDARSWFPVCGSDVEVIPLYGLTAELFEQLVFRDLERTPADAFGDRPVGRFIALGEGEGATIRVLANWKLGVAHKQIWDLIVERSAAMPLGRPVAIHDFQTFGHAEALVEHLASVQLEVTRLVEGQPVDRVARLIFNWEAAGRHILVDTNPAVLQIYHAGPGKR